MNCRGDEDIDAKRSRPSIGKPVMGHASKERVVLFGTDQRITSGPAAKRPHSKAEYMTAPEPFADSQIPLAPRAPSIHDPSVLGWADFYGVVMRGLDPRIHRLDKTILAKEMDRRVKPGDDGGWIILT